MLKIIETPAAGSQEPGLLAAMTSVPTISIDPAVGSISRISVRTSVDLPDPDSPMTTNTLPGLTSSETSRTAATQPVFSRNSPPRERRIGCAEDALGLRAEDLPDTVRSDERFGVTSAVHGGLTAQQNRLQTTGIR